MKDDENELSDELNLLKKRREDEITVLDKSIRKLQGELNSIQSLIRKEESSLAEEKRQKSAEAENSYKENSQVLNNDLSAITEDLKTKTEAFSSEETMMQKNKVKGQMNLREIVDKYDTDMMELQSELDRTQAVFDAEQKELAELTEYFTKWDAERAYVVHCCIIHFWLRCCLSFSSLR